MSIKKIFLTGFAVAAFGSLAMAQGGQPNQPPRGDREGGMRGRPEMRGDRDGKRGGKGGMRGFAMRRGGRGMNLERLNLTDAQKLRIQAIQQSARSAREANKSQFEELGNLMRLKREGLLTDEQGTRLNALQVQMQTRMRADMEKMRNDILSVLTPDQKTLFEQGRGEGAGNRRMRRPNGPGQPPPPQGTN
jgi:Spy/CpxP family protein refolding chaperone